MPPNQIHHLGEGSLANAKSLAARIKPGMQRYEVERLFGIGRWDLQGPSLTIYDRIPGARVEVCFDDQGGKGALMNRVLNSPKVYLVIS